uniref:Uncharacterized protein n=1 Tax=Rhizophora mucronata TaxID=61149 RepID=A0A2P2NT54_RHIMU
MHVLNPQPIFKLRTVVFCGFSFDNLWSLGTWSPMP